MFMHDPTLYGATFPYREFTLQNPTLTPWQTLSTMKPIHNPYVGFTPPVPEMVCPPISTVATPIQNLPFTPQVPWIPYTVPQLSSVQSNIPGMPWTVNPFVPRAISWNSPWNTPWNAPVGLQSRLPF